MYKQVYYAFKNEKNINRIKIVRMDVFLNADKKIRFCAMKKGGNEYELYAS